MEKQGNNYAFIDGQNLYLGVKSLGWKMDYKKFYTHLTDTYRVTCVFIFLGYLEEYEPLYRQLREFGYTIIFKEVSHDHEGAPKGNVDVLLTLHAMLHNDDLKKAVLVTSDGDFAPLVEHWSANKKLRAVISTRRPQCSWLLRKAAGGYLDYLDSVKHLLIFDAPETKKRP